jgi:SAM-dependent methyltransferase
MRYRQQDMSATDNEKSLYGRKWNLVHEGYFSDPAVAAPFISAIEGAIHTSHPSVVADLGGGTGFVLAILAEHDKQGDVVYLDVDTSPEQLAQARDSRIPCITCSIPEVRRERLVTGGGTLLACMRSVLHYFGEAGLKPVLRHLRSEMRAGEYLVHQTASFARARDQEILNRLYDGMDTGKWYPTLDELALALREEGWEIEAVEPAPSLVLTMPELAQRYSIDREVLMSLGREILAIYGPTPGTFTPVAEGFTAWLGYHIVTCRAA